MLAAEMIDNWRGLADRLRKMEEEPICELMRGAVNPVGWGLGDVTSGTGYFCFGQFLAW